MPSVTRVASLVLLLAGCATTPPTGRSYGCRCEALTDTDQPTQVDVAVCAGGDADAPTVARGVAVTAGHVTIQQCRCEVRGPCPPDR